MALKSDMKLVQAVACESLAATCLFLSPVGVRAETDGGPSQRPQVVDERTAIFVNSQLTTWIRRGRMLMDVEGLVRRKLTTAGFQVVPKATDTHRLTLTVTYQEARGRQYRFDTYGTNITCQFRLDHVKSGTLMDLTIRESSGDELRGTPPYIEAIQNFETNPYVYLLGDLVKGRVLSGLDTHAALIQGLQRVVREARSAVDPLSLPHTMSQAESGYVAQARDNTIQELGRLRESRAVPVLLSLLEDADAHVRRLSAVALGAIGSAESRSALEHVARSDSNPYVREAAVAALSGLIPVPPP